MLSGARVHTTHPTITRFFTHPQTLTDLYDVVTRFSLLYHPSGRQFPRRLGILGKNLRGVIMKQKDIRPAPSLIEFKSMRFLITDRPSDVTIQSYLQELRKHNVCTVVRVCEPSYDTAPLKAEGIEVRDLAYDDGTFPPANVVDDWFEILRDKAQNKPEAAVAVHCVAGLGRAPVMVAIALIELGMKYEEAVETIRDQRRGAINAKQLSYLEKYRPKSRLKKNGHKNSCCVQ